VYVIGSAKLTKSRQPPYFWWNYCKKLFPLLGHFQSIFMNRLLVLSLFFLPKICVGQSYGLCMQVIGSTGGSGAQGNYEVSWTVGEMVVTTVSGTDYTLTQGFHQPDVCLPVSTWNLDLEALAIEAFPNPVDAFLTIRFNESTDAQLQVSAFDMLGRQVMDWQPLDTPDGTLIATLDWQPGVYFLQIVDVNTLAAATVRIVRI
jgi:hypothetical protein